MQALRSAVPLSARPCDIEIAAIKAFEPRVFNWGRYVGSSQEPHATCASAERYYRPGRADEEKLKPLAFTPIDVRDGDLVERGVCNIKSRWARELLKCIYVNHYHPKHTCRLMRIQDVRLLEPSRMRVVGELQGHVQRIEAALAWSQRKYIQHRLRES